mgnify:CR=1 FL=1
MSLVTLLTSAYSYGLPISIEYRYRMCLVILLVGSDKILEVKGLSRSPRRARSKIFSQINLYLSFR